MKEIIKPLPENHNIEDRVNAMAYAFAPNGPYTGLFYKVQRPTYEERYADIISKAKHLSGENYSIEDVMKQFK